MKKYIHVIAGLSLALAVTGCANDGDSVVSQAAAAAIQRSQEDDGSKLNASIATSLASISALKTAGGTTLSPAVANVVVTGTVTSADLYVLRDAIRELNSAGSKTVGVTVDFRNAEFANNEIPNHTFNKCEKLSSVILPDTVTKIGDWAFNEMSASINYYNKTTAGVVQNALPPSVKEIGTGAFSFNHYAYGSTTGFTSLVVPEGVTTLCAAFTGSATLTSITLPSTLTSMPALADNNDTDNQKYGVFEFTNIAEIKFNGTKAQWNAITPKDDWDADKWGRSITAKYVQCRDGKVWRIAITPAVATAIDQIEAATGPVTVSFGAISLTTEDWTEIKNAVKNAPQLVTLNFTNTTLPNGTTTVPARAFEQCYKLAGITLPASVTAIAHNAFEGCNFLTSINLENVITIGSSAFAGCSRLGTVNLSRATAIGISAFQNTALTSVAIPATVNGANSIGNEAFKDCESLTTVTYDGTADQFKTAIGTNVSTIFPATIKKVTCSEGAGVTKNYWLGASEAGNTAINAIEAVTTDYAAPTKTVITGALTTKDIELIKVVIRASQYTLYLDMTGATFPNNTVPITAFSGCDKLVGIDLPTTITEILQGAFGSCIAVTDVTIPAAVTSLGMGVFRGCTTLATVTFGASGQTTALTSIGNNCFYSCSALATVTYIGTTENWNRIAKGTGYKEGVPSPLSVTTDDSATNAATF